MWKNPFPRPRRSDVAAHAFWLCMQWEFDKTLTARERDKLWHSADKLTWWVTTILE